MILFRQKIYFFLIIICLFPGLLSAYEMTECISCHSDNPGKNIPQISIKDYRESIHETMMTCVDCHSYILEGHENGEVKEKVNCNNCHLQENLHGAASGNNKQPQCHECHTKHKILPSSIESSPVHEAQFKKMCIECHKRQYGEQDFLEWFTSFRIKSHKKQNFTKEYDKTTCEGCHQKIEIHDRTLKSTDNECAGCHMKDNRNAMMGRFHAGNSPELIILCLALFFMASLLFRRLTLLRRGMPEKSHADPLFLLKYLVGHKKILNNPVTGTMHIVVFWGCLLPVIVIIFAHIRIILPGVLALFLSVSLDIVGLLLLVTVFIFFIRRFISKDTLGPKRSLLPLIILILILLSGFIAEGIRLSILSSMGIWASPVGYAFSFFLPASPVMMQLMIKAHFYLTLLLIAVIPFTFFRHLCFAPLNIIYKKGGNTGELRAMAPFNGFPGANHIADFSWKQLLETEACVSCGRCEENCPAFISGKPLSPRKIVRTIFDLSRSSDNATLDSCFSPDEIWSCTTCMACVEACPVYSAPMDKIVEIRRYLTMGKGEIPHEARTMIRSLELYGDVNGKGPSLRTAWAMNRGVNITAPEDRDVEIVIWTGCSGAFHPRYQDVSRALVKILQKAGVNFRILGNNELCCGDPARRLGEEELFISLARKNIRTFREHNVNKIITLCPHCFNTLKNEYPKIESDDNYRFEVIHAAQYVKKLIDKKFVIPEFPLLKSITLHDPCYLGRANNIYKPLRDIIASIPGASFTELERSCEKSFCCGAGGGGMWLHEHLGKRINVIRSEEIVEKGTDVVCTACPYCQTTISDGINGLELDEPPEVLDIIEVVERVLR